MKIMSTYVKDFLALFLLSPSISFAIVHGAP